MFDEWVRGKLWRIIRKIYEKTESCVLVGDKKTDYFEVEVGVQQGCILSPTLFSIFISNMADEVNQTGGGIDVAGRKVAILLYADDIVLISDSARGLQSSMRIVTKWGRRWQCRFNRGKSQVVVYGSRKVRYGDWMLGGGKVKQVDSYKYLGMEIQGNRG